ncbi:MAG: SDR family oxidoreductase, partial [Clostridiales bacterium]|nr:SDR family oxidoreductase [Clostridiales bacterium]
MAQNGANATGAAGAERVAVAVGAAGAERVANPAPKVAVVTGAGSGLGRGIAKALAMNGYDVGIHSGSNAERARALAKELGETSGRRVEAFESDFTQPGGAVRLFEQFNGKFDRLDLFVNNAGVTMGGRILDLTEEVFDTVNNI